MLRMQLASPSATTPARSAHGNDAYLAISKRIRALDSTRCAGRTILLATIAERRKQGAAAQAHVSPLQLVPRCECGKRYFLDVLPRFMLPLMLTLIRSGEKR